MAHEIQDQAKAGRAELSKQKRSILQHSLTSAAAILPTLTEQMPAGDAPLGDGSFHGTDGGGEDVGLLEDLGQLGSV